MPAMTDDLDPQLVEAVGAAIEDREDTWCAIVDREWADTGEEGEELVGWDVVGAVLANGEAIVDAEAEIKLESADPGYFTVVLSIIASARRQGNGWQVTSCDHDRDEERP